MGTQGFGLMANGPRHGRASFRRLFAAVAHVTFLCDFQHYAADSSPVMLDVHRIEQVFDNLVENALRYTPANGQISLTCLRDPRGITLILRDSGSGIAAEDMPHIWEKFYHGHDSPDGKPSKTTGLGLYICKLLIERHGGTITLDNRPAGGCEASVWLPVIGA